MGKIRNADIFLIVTVAGCAIMIAILYSNAFPELNGTIAGISGGFKDFGRTNGLWAAFLLSMFGNTSILIIIPYSYVVFLLGLDASTAAASIWYPVLLGIISGLGAGIGEISSYIVGRLFRRSEKLVNGDLGKKFERMRVTFEKHPRLIPLFVFLFAATPMPDDVILIPFGVMKYSYIKTVIPCMLGKMFLCILIAYLGFAIGGNIANTPLGFLVSDTEDPGRDMIMLIPLFVVVWAMVRLDFQKVIEKMQNLSKKRSIKAAKAGDPCPKCGAPMAETIVTEKATGKRKKTVACGSCDALV